MHILTMLLIATLIQTGTSAQTVYSPGADAQLHGEITPATTIVLELAKEKPLHSRLAQDAKDLTAATFKWPVTAAKYIGSTRPVRATGRACKAAGHKIVQVNDSAPVQATARVVSTATTLTSGWFFARKMFQPGAKL